MIMGAGTAPDGASAQTIRSRIAGWAAGFFGTFAIGVALLTTAADNVWTRASLGAVTAGLVVLTVRSVGLRLVYDGAGVTSHQLVRRASYPWSAIDRIGVADATIIGARLANGQWVHLLRYRGLGDTSTTRMAEELSEALLAHTSSPPTMEHWQRRPPPPRHVLVAAVVVFAVAILGYSIATGNWFALAWFGVQFVLQRWVTPPADRGFHPVGSGTDRRRDHAPE